MADLHEPKAAATAPVVRKKAAPIDDAPVRGAMAYLGAFLAGGAYFLAFAGFDVWPLAFVALVPFRVVLERAPVKRATLLGLTCGFAMNASGFYWLLGMLRTFSGFGWALCGVFFAILCAYQAGRFAMVGWLFARARARGWNASLVFIGAFAASELLFPLLFPWYYAACIHKLPLLLQCADLGGPILVGAIMVGANLALAEPMLARLTRRPMKNVEVIAPLVALVLDAAYGAIRMRGVDADVAAAPSAKVGMVQANMGLLEKRVNMDEGLMRHLADTQKLKAEGIDFVVWSETSAMRPMRESDYTREVPWTIGRRLGVPGIIGAVLIKPHPDPRRRYVLYNSALSVTAKGEVNGRYDKEYLLAFGEYIPLGETFPALYDASPNSGRFSPGTELTPLTIDIAGEQHAVATLICYEDILPGFTNAAVRSTSPELLVNITNDAWFGDSTEPWEHLALAKLRAIEHRRFLVRSTNSGVSAVVDPVGRIVAKSNTFVEATTSATIRWLRASTVYEKVGDAPWYAISLAIVVAAFVRKRSKEDGASQ
jgi:apolipoprotein N-acyltransferase